MDRSTEHHCLPRPAQPCPYCGEMLPPPVFCEICGANILPQHVCSPHPLPHVCADRPTPGLCLACGEELPARRFCATCGAEITPSHRCSAAPPTHIHRPDPIHTCPSLKLPRCDRCGELMPAMRFCETCGVEITPPHICTPQPEAHTCPPVVTMPHRCSTCGELLPKPRHCTQCGADITPQHTCARNEKTP